MIDIFILQEDVFRLKDVGIIGIKIWPTFKKLLNCPVIKCRVFLKCSFFFFKMYPKIN